MSDPMTVRDALEKLLRSDYDDFPRTNANVLAPIVEKALRAAYLKGLHAYSVDDAVAAGIAVLTEGAEQP